jgi:hypothetical protein
LLEALVEAEVGVQKLDLLEELVEAGVLLVGVAEAEVVDYLLKLIRALVVQVLLVK